MKTLWASMKRRLFSLSAGQTKYARRGFHGATEDVQMRLEQIGAVFVYGYNVALEHDTEVELAAVLNSVELELRGFAFEGAAMGLALLDYLTPWRRTRVSEFLDGAGDAHAYMVHVGIGWVWARLPVNFRRAQTRLDPVLGWLAFDGWGFHEGFFHWPKYIAGQPAPKNCPVTNGVFLIKAWAARSGSSTAGTSNSSRKQFQLFPPTGNPICGAASAWARPTLESSARLRSANCARNPPHSSRSLPKARPSPPRPGNARGT